MHGMHRMRGMRVTFLLKKKSNQKKTLQRDFMVVAKSGKMAIF